VDNTLPGSSANGYIASFTLAGLDHVEVFFECPPGCNSVPPAVTYTIGLQRGFKPQHLKAFRIKTLGMSVEEKTILKMCFIFR
jgi:hypothetical protein